MKKINYGLSVWGKPRTASHKLSVSYGRDATKDLKPNN